MHITKVVVKNYRCLRDTTVDLNPHLNVLVGNNECGKSTFLEAVSAQRSALLTYTNNNVEELKRRFYEMNSGSPERVEIWSWYTFLLHEMARPYQNSLYSGRIDGIFWVEGRSQTFAEARKIEKHYFHDSKRIYSDKIARFIYECDRISGGAVISRLEQRFDRLYIDEIQDMAGWDIDLVEMLLRSRIAVTLMGDHRQATFKTNHAAKNSGYGGIKIINKFREWDKARLCSVSYETETHRCNQKIADVADAFFPKEPKTRSLNKRLTGHDGVFAISSTDVATYVEEYQPQVLRLDIKTNCNGYPALNFGDSKGLTFERVLIFPHKLGTKWLTTGDITHVEKSAARMYVGVSRARQSVAFVHDGFVLADGIERYR